jgi:hypothetical protein
MAAARARTLAVSLCAVCFEPPQSSPFGGAGFAWFVFPGNNSGARQWTLHGGPMSMIGFWPRNGSFTGS